MKATNLAIWSLAVLIATGFTACKKDDMKITEPHITLTTTKNKGEMISLLINAAAEDRADVWIDLNNNGIEDSGEADIEFTKNKGYPLGAQTITIYGKVTSLVCSDNRLKALDVSKNSALWRIDCDNNQLTSLNLSNSIELFRLYCGNNQLTSLNFSNNPKLEWLWCPDNQLTSLNVSNSTELLYLCCDNNQITSLNLSNNPKLEDLWCCGNQITALDVSKNTNLRHLGCYNNSIYGSNMTALVNSLPTRNAGKEGDFYVVNKNGDGNVCTPAQVNIAKNKNWDVMDSEGNTYSGSK